MKKAQSMQFNWILVLVAGSIFLLFFILLTIDYKQLSEKKLNTQLAVAIDQEISLLKSAKLTTKLNPEGINEFNLITTCQDILINNAAPVDFSDKLIFSPSEINTDTLLIWINSLYLPYKIDSLIYLSSPNIKYLILEQPNTKDFINSLLDFMPKTQENKQFFNIEVINSINQNSINTIIKNERIKELRFILFSDQEIPEFQVKANKIIIQPKDSGFVNYNKKQSYYINKELLLAAIFSDNYDCMLDKTLNKINLVNQIYLEKASSLFSKLSNNQNCQYQFIISNLNEFSTNNIQLLNEQSLTILKQNEALKNKGCQDVF